MSEGGRFLKFQDSDIIFWNFLNILFNLFNALFKDLVHNTAPDFLAFVIRMARMQPGLVLDLLQEVGAQDEG